MHDKVSIHIKAFSVTFCSLHHICLMTQLQRGYIRDRLYFYAFSYIIKVGKVNYIFIHTYKNIQMSRHLGGSVKRPTSAQVTISLFVGSSPASGSADSLIQILCLPLSLPLPSSCSVSLSLSK